MAVRNQVGVADRGDEQDRPQSQASDQNRSRTVARMARIRIISSWQPRTSVRA